MLSTYTITAAFKVHPIICGLKLIRFLGVFLLNKSKKIKTSPIDKHNNSIRNGIGGVCEPENPLLKPVQMARTNAAK
jgi:hypothetical protein